MSRFKYNGETEEYFFIMLSSTKIPIVVVFTTASNSVLEQVARDISKKLLILLY